MSLSMLAHPFRFTMISCAAINRPCLTVQGDYARPRDHELTMTKVRLIVEAAAHAGSNALVLSVFGCGAYRNPP